MIRLRSDLEIEHKKAEVQPDVILPLIMVRNLLLFGVKFCVVYVNRKVDSC